VLVTQADLPRILGSSDAEPASVAADSDRDA
jgi:hypothetical protein